MEAINHFDLLLMTPDQSDEYCTVLVTSFKSACSWMNKPFLFKRCFQLVTVPQYVKGFLSLSAEKLKLEL